MNIFDQIINQSKLGTPGQFSGGTSFGSINTQDFQSKLPTIQKSVQAEQNLRNQGFSEKEVKFLKLQKDKGVDMNQAFAFVEQKRAEEAQARNPDLGFMGGLKEGAIGVTQFGQQAPAVAGNLLDLTQRYVTTPLLAGGAEMLGAEDLAGRIRAGGEKFGRLAKESGEQFSEEAMQAFGPLTENQLQARKTGANIALSSAVPLGSVPKLIQGAKLAPTIARGAHYGAVGTPAYTAMSEGRLPTGGEMVAGTAGGAVLGPVAEKLVIPGVVKGVQKSGKYGEALQKGGIEGAKKSITRDIQAIKTPGVESVTRNIPRAVVRRDLGFTPTERKNIEKITGKDEATYILEKGLAGKGKEELAEIFMKQSDDMYNGITRELSKVDARVQSPVAKEALLDILEQLESSPKIARAYAKDIEGVKAMLARNDFSVSELNNIRRAYDKVNTGMFTVQGKARSGLENAIDVKVRQDLSSQLQKEAKKYGVDVKAMNTELRAGLEMKDALLRRLSQEERNNFIGLQDLGVSAILSGGNPVTAIATIGAKKYAEKVAPGISQKLFNLNKTPNVTPRVSRGNTITPRNKSSQLGLADGSGDNVVSNVTVKVTPKPLSNGSKVSKPTSSTNSTSANSETIKKPLKKEVKPEKSDSTKQDNIQKDAEISKLWNETEGRWMGFTKENEQGIEAFIYDKKTKKEESIGVWRNKKVADEMAGETIRDKRMQYSNDRLDRLNTEIPEGYIKNPLTGQIIKKPSNSKGGFVRLPSVKPRKLSSPADKSPDKALVEEVGKHTEGFKEGKLFDISPQSKSKISEMEIKADMGEIKQTDISNLNKWLKDNKDNYIKLYHGTSPTHDILGQGLRATTNKTKKSIQSAPGFVYLSFDPGRAKTFGEMAYAGKSSKVYEAIIRIGDLKPDLDQLGNKRYWSKNPDIGSTLADSLLYGKGFRVKGNIEPYKIIEYNPQKIK